MKTTVVIERGATSFGAYVPDLPGCVAVGETREEALELIEEAVVGSSKACAKKVRRCPNRFRAAS